MDIHKILQEDPLYEAYEPDPKLLEELIQFVGSIDRYCPEYNKDSGLLTDRMRGVNFRGTVDDEYENPRIIQIKFYCG